MDKSRDLLPQVDDLDLKANQKGSQMLRPFNPFETPQNLSSMFDDNGSSPKSNQNDPMTLKSKTIYGSNFKNSGRILVTNKTIDIKSSGDYRSYQHNRSKFQWQGQFYTGGLKSQEVEVNEAVSIRQVQIKENESEVGGSQQILKSPSSLQPSSRIPNGGMNTIWSLRALPIIHYISKFIQQLKTKTDKIKFRLITHKVFSIIGDPSSDYQTIVEWRKQLSAKTLGYLILKYTKLIGVGLAHAFHSFGVFISNHIHVIQPDSVFKLIWDTLVVFLIILNIFYIPMKISFQIDKKDSQFTTFLLETFPSYVFITEILLNFNTAYYHKGIIHTSRKQIIKYYLGRKFFWDLIVVVPFIISQFNIPYTDFTVILRVTRVKGMVEQLEQVLNMRENYQAIFDLIKLIYFMLFISHFCACAWHYLAIIEIDVWNSSNSWLIDNGLEALPWVQRYIASFYWSIITILTVGYGDITPVTDYERVFVIFVALIICGAFGYSISAVGQIIQRLEEKKNIQRAKLKIINQHIQKRGLNQALQLKVRKYFEYYFKLEEEENSKAEILMSQLTRRLKEEVLADIYYKVLKGSRFLGKNFSKEFLNQLCPYLKERKFAPEEDIFSRGEVAQKLIFILSGEVQIYAAGQTDADKIVETNFRTYKQGFVIGEREFCTNRMFEYNARAVRFTQVALLDFDDFHRVISENEEDFEKFCLLRDNLTFNQNYKIIGRVCEICQSSHSFQRCPFVFFQANQAKILTKFRSTKNQMRYGLHQRHHGKSQILSCVTDIQEAALAFITTNKLLPDEQLSDEYLEKLGFKLIQQETKSPSFKSSSMRTDDICSLKDKDKIKVQSKKRKKATNLFQMVNHIRERQMTQDTPEPTRKKQNSVRNLDFTQIEDIEDDYSDQSNLIIKMPSLYPTEFKERYKTNQVDTDINDNSIVIKKMDGPYMKQFSVASQESAIYDKPLDTPQRFKLMQFIEDKSHQRRRSQERYKSIIQSEQVKVFKRNASTLSVVCEESNHLKYQKQDEINGYKREVTAERKFLYDAPEGKQQPTNSPLRIQNLQINTQRHVDFDIDRQKSYTLYFPMFNIENIMKKTNPVREIKQSNRLAKISQGLSTNPFDRIKTINNVKLK